jgi:hypothetical protein
MVIAMIATDPEIAAGNANPGVICHSSGRYAELR